MCNSRYEDGHDAGQLQFTSNIFHKIPLGLIATSSIFFSAASIGASFPKIMSACMMSFFYGHAAGLAQNTQLLLRPWTFKLQLLWPHLAFDGLAAIKTIGFARAFGFLLNSSTQTHCFMSESPMGCGCCGVLQSLPKICITHHHVFK